MKRNTKYRKTLKRKNKKLTKQKQTIEKSKTHKNTTNKNTTHKNSICAPFIQPKNISGSSKFGKANMNILESATDETCFSIEALRKIANKWNQSHPTMRIEYDNNTTGKTLWNSLHNVMRYKCDNEVCWIKQDFMKNSPLAQELIKNFKPLMPKKWYSKPTEWLNTLDIRDVMNQYETKYPEFEFIGPVPMDFDTKVGFGQCVVNELCKISLEEQIKRGKTKIGVVFNLDKHNQPGSHWVCMMCQLNTPTVNIGQICYWDSYGMKPNPEVVILMNRLKEQGSKLGHDLTIKVNPNRHQFKNSECGVYCIYFLTSLLDGKSFEDIVNSIVSDDNMNDKRDEFFAMVGTE